MWRRGNIVDQERHYEAVEIDVAGVAGDFRVRHLRYTPSESGRYFIARSESNVDTAGTRQTAVVIAVDYLLDRPASTDTQREVASEDWITQRDPAPDYAGAALTDFDPDDLPDTETPDLSLRERLIEEHGGEDFDVGGLPTLPKQVGDWQLRTVPDGVDSSEFEGNRVITHYGTDVTSDEPPRAVSINRPGFSDDEYLVFAHQPEVNRQFISNDDIIADENVGVLVDRLIRYLDINPPSSVENPRFDRNLVDAVPDEGGWEYRYTQISNRKDTIVWERGNPDVPNQPGERYWRIAVVGHPTSRNYNATFTPFASDSMEYGSYKFEDVDVVLPPNPSYWAIGDRMRQVAEIINQNPDDPTRASAIPADSQAPADELMSPDEVARELRALTATFQGGNVTPIADTLDVVDQYAEVIDVLDKRAYESSDGLRLRQLAARFGERVNGVMRLRASEIGPGRDEQLTDAIKESALMMNRRNAHPREMVDTIREEAEDLRGRIDL